MTFQIGDVVNGHRLGPDNEWHPVEPATAAQSIAPPPGQPPPGATDTPPLSASPQKKPWYRRWWVIALAVIVLLLIVWPKGGGNSANTSSSAAPSAAVPTAPSTGASNAPAAPAPAAPQAAAAAGLNTPVRDGDFEFTVSGVKCGETMVGNQYINKTAQGQFCLVSMTVTNIGKDAQLFDGSNQKAIDGQGRKLQADGSATVYVENAKSFLENVNPGNQVKGTVVFDIPKTSTITELGLHDSAFSNGVKVKVA